MKEDYLWDKTGADAEIESFENALQTFRFQESTPPVLPQKVFVVEKDKPRRWSRFGFAFAAFASVLIVFSIVWFQLSPGKAPLDEIVSQDSPANNAEQKADEVFKETHANEPAKPTKVSAPALIQPKVVKIRLKSAPVARPVKAVLRKTTRKAPAETLTAEERYAYNQLMLALAITGSQLKIVKDKVQGIEDQNAALETAK